MRRVKKEEIQFNTWIKPDGYTICMACWKAYMHTDDRDLSASRMKLSTGEPNRTAEGYEHDLYAEQRQADMRIGEAANAMISGLKTVQRWAIYRKYGISTVWNFPSADLLQVLDTAEVLLEEKLRKNLATATMF